MTFTPRTEICQNALHVQLSDGHKIRNVGFDCVIDFTGDGQIVGVEIMDFARQSDGGVVEPAQVSDDFRWAYDPEIDAFYLHVQKGPAPVQKKSTGVVFMDDGGRVVALEVALPAEAGRQQT